MKLIVNKNYYIDDFVLFDICKWSNSFLKNKFYYIFDIEHITDEVSNFINNSQLN